ncbi:MAG: protein kinase, partial [Gallionellaceae bacterium]
MPIANLDKTCKLIEESAQDMESIGGYTIVRLLGRGATSSVYLGVDKATLKLVAIKKMSAQCGIALQRKMFVIEASLCGKLKHPNIVSLFEANSSDPANSYIIMEYVEGDPLDKFSSPDNLLPVESVIDIIRQSAEALNYAFQMGVIHRDVKP